MIEYYTGVLKNYVGFEGRARRAEFWYFALTNFIIAIVLDVIGMAIGTSLLSSVYSLAVFLPGLAVAVRRLHDTGRSGWWYLIFLTCVGIIVLIVWFCEDSKPGPNQYGENPKGIGNQPMDQYGNPYNPGTGL